MLIAVILGTFLSRQQEYIPLIFRNLRRNIVWSYRHFCIKTTREYRPLIFRNLRRNIVWSCHGYQLQVSNSAPLRGDFFQVWKFAHRFSERITRFLRKNERMSNSLKKTSASFMPSFLVSNLRWILQLQ